MAAIKNARDVLLQAAPSRYSNPPNAAILLVASSPVFHVANGGAFGPATITFTASLIDLAGPVTFVATGGTLTVVGNVATLTYANMPGATATVKATLTENGQAYESNLCNITKVADGTNGTVGLNNARVYAYQRAATAPTLSPGDVTVTFASNSITNPPALLNSWVREIPSTNGNPLYVVAISGAGTGTTVNLAASSWSGATVMATDGPGGTGTNGTNGLNAATVMIFQRSATATALAKPTLDTTYTFASGALTGLNNGWSQSVPAADPAKPFLQTTLATAISASATDTVPATEWATVQVLARDGVDGSVLYTWIKYGTSVAGAGLSDSPDGMTYIGLAHNKTTATESIVATDYTWSLIKGTDGVAGSPGANGTTTYTWIKYSDSADGAGLYDVPTSTTLYIGIAVNKTTATESTLNTDYVWSKFKGDQGVPGASVTGQTGARGAGNYHTTGSAWSDAAADAVTPGENIAGDFVTISNGTTFIQVRQWSGSAWVLKDQVFNGGAIFPGTVTSIQVNTNGMSVRKTDGTLILDAGGGGLQAGFEAPGTKNNLITIAANGALSNAGGGAVTIGGLGYAGDLDATKGADASNLKAGVGINRLSNSMPNNLTTYIAHKNHALALENAGAGGVGLAMRGASYDIYSPLRQCGYVHTIGATADGNLDDVWINENNKLAVVPGKRYEFAYFASVHRGAASAYIAWYNGTGVYMSESLGADGALDAQGSYSTGVPRVGLFASAPVGAYFAMPVMRIKHKSGAGYADPFLFFSGLFFSEALPSQTVFTPWGDGAPLDTRAIGYTGDLNASSDITLVGRGGCTIAGNRIVKSGGTESSWTADAYSKESFKGGAFASAKIEVSTGQYMFGLNSDPVTDGIYPDGSYESIDFAIYLVALAVHCYENGAYKGQIGTCVIGDVLTVQYDGSNVAYLNGSAVLRTAAATNPDPLFFDSSFHTVGTSIAGVRFGPMTSNAWAAVGGPNRPSDNATADINLMAYGTCYVTGNTIGKLSGGTTGWDSDVRSKDGFVGGAFASAVTPAIGLQMMFGLNSAADLADTSYTSLDYSIYLAGTGLYYYESNTPGAQIGTYAAGDVLAVAYDGSTVKYYQNGVVLRSVAATITTALYFDSSFNNPNTILTNVRFGPLTSNAWGAIGGPNKPQDNATVGAPAGTYVGSNLAQDLETLAGAQAKANAAQATAISTAATAAQTKADLAKTQAQAYADGIVTAEEARAISDATNKANAAQAAATTAAAQDATAKANVAATTSNWSGVANNDGNRPANGATVGAPAGTLVGGTLAQTVEANASTALANAAAANNALANKLNKNADDILGGVLAVNTVAAPVGLRIGNVIWNGAGDWVSGTGVAITPKGVAGFGAGGAVQFAINATTGAATFAGALSAATGSFAGSLSAATGTFAGSLSAATGSFGAVTIAAGGSVSSGQTAFNTGNGYHLSFAAGVAKFSVGNSAGAYMYYDGSVLRVSGVTYDTFTLTLAGVLSTGGSGVRYFSTPAATPVGGKAPFTYSWTFTSDPSATGISIQSGANAAILNLASINKTAGSFSAGTGICTISDADGRTVTASCNIQADY